jgi:hypothetical protein
MVFVLEIKWRGSLEKKKWWSLVGGSCCRFAAPRIPYSLMTDWGSFFWGIFSLTLCAGKKGGIEQVGTSISATVGSDFWGKSGDCGKARTRRVVAAATSTRSNNNSDPTTDEATILHRHSNIVLVVQKQQ